MKIAGRNKNAFSRGKKTDGKAERNSEQRKKCREVKERLGEGCAIIWHQLLALVP